MAKNPVLIVAVVIALVISIPTIVSVFQYKQPREVVSGTSDDSRQLSVTLSGGAGAVNNDSIYAERFEINENKGLGLYGSFEVAANSLVHFYITDQKGWDEIWEDGDTDRTWNYIHDTTGIENWAYKLPSIGVWYVVYSRTPYVDLAKTISGWTCRDLTPPSLEVSFSAMPLEGLVSINVTATDQNFPISEVEIYLRGQLLVPPFTESLGQHFSRIIPWNSTDFDDGDYVFEVNASDTAGNEVTYSQVISILNKPDYTFTVLVIVGLLTIVLLLVQLVREELSAPSFILGMIALFTAEVVLWGIVGLSYFDIDDAISLVSSIIAIVAASYAIAYVYEKARG